MRVPALAGLMGGVINRRVIQWHWEELLRLATSIKHGTVTASLLLIVAESANNPVFTPTSREDE
jgi:TnpA family transposase